jgi:hypothetical protein
MGLFSHIPRPFRTETVDDYQGVLVPLSRAKRHETVEAEYARRYSLEGRPISPSGSKKDEDAQKDKAIDEETGAPTQSRVWDGVYTVETLREEVNADVAASGHDSSYDCEYIPGEVPCNAVNAETRVERPSDC